MRPSRGVISFDLDGTLIQGPFASVLREVCNAIEPASPDGLYQEVLRRHEELLLTDEYAAYGWSAMVAAAAGARGISVGADIVTERIVGRLEEAATRTRMLHPDTPEVLTTLRSAGWRVVILTNGRRAFQEPVIAGAGLLPVIDGWVTSDDAGSAKPAPAAFDFARGAAGLHIHVGDRLDHDVAGAAQSGALSLLLRVDAPVSGLVQNVSARRYRTLQEYLRTRHAVERHIEPAAQLDLPAEVVPDAVATDLRAAAQLIDALEAQRSTVP